MVYEQRRNRQVGYSERVLKELSLRLTKYIGREFSERNLKYVRRFYLEYYEIISQIAQTVSGQLPAKTPTETPIGQTLSAQFTPMFPIRWSVSCVAASTFRGVTTGEEIPMPGNLCATQIECDPIYWVKTQLIRAMTHNLGPDANGDVDVCAHFSAHNRHCAASF